jgi:DNA-binding IclR family transcriptional regulator
MIEPKKAQQGINSVVIGMSVLDVIVDAGSALSLNAIASQVEMSPAKVHRYLVSLIGTGLVTRLKEPGLYDLGPKALKLGFKAIKRIDRVTIANEELGTLNSLVDETVFLSIWNDGEALVVGRKASSRPITLMVRIGEVLSPVYSATGRLFVAFLDDQQMDRVLNGYSSLPSKPQLNGREIGKAEYLEELAAIQKTQFSLGLGEFQSNVVSMSVPIMGPRGTVEFVLTVIGYESDIGGENNIAAERIKKALFQSQQTLTEKLGTWEAI